MTKRHSRAVYVISVAAELAGMHAQTLRMYERKGLLTPNRTRGGSRRYSELDVERLRRIAELTACGLSLEGVKMVVELEAAVEVLSERVEQLEAENHALRLKYQRDLVPFGAGYTVIRRVHPMPPAREATGETKR